MLTLLNYSLWINFIIFSFILCILNHAGFLLLPILLYIKFILNVIKQLSLKNLKLLIYILNLRVVSIIWIHQLALVDFTDWLKLFYDGWI